VNNKCPKLDTCWKFKTINDLNITTELWEKMIETACKKCEEIGLNRVIK